MSFNIQQVNPDDLFLIFTICSYIGGHIEYGNEPNLIQFLGILSRTTYTNMRLQAEECAGSEPKLLNFLGEISRIRDTNMRCLQLKLVTAG